MNKKILWIIAAMIILISAGTYLAFASNQQKLSPPQTPPSSEPITVSGEITCLPKKGPGPHTMECAIGIKGDDGKYYGLKNLFEHDKEYKFYSTGMRVEVSGTLNYEEMLGPGGGPYDVAGVIEITSIRER